MDAMRDKVGNASQQAEVKEQVLELIPRISKDLIEINLSLI
jgi:hypothetical protein